MYLIIRLAFNNLKKDSLNQLYYYKDMVNINVIKVLKNFISVMY